MHRARQHSDTRTAQRRQLLAREAAKLIAEGGSIDVQQARRKAAMRLGIHDEASMPPDADVEAALDEHRRLFQGAGHAALLRERREAALQALGFLAAFTPRLVGAVLDGTAERHSSVVLHLHADDADAVARFLEEAGIPARAGARRVWFDRKRQATVPTWSFQAAEVGFELLVLPSSALRQAPLAGSGGAPVRRCSEAQLRALLAGPG